MINSAIYFGTIRHRRYEPVCHAFKHSIGMLYLDLDELPNVLEHPPFWSARHAAPGRFRRSDYLGDPNVPLRQAVASVVERRTGTRPDGPIRMLTIPRTAGRAFSPLSLFYCFARDDAHAPAFVVAEVTNTPWREPHCYVLDLRAASTPLSGDRQRETLRQSSRKVLHVSPFMGMQQSYRWALTSPGTTLTVHIDTLDETRLGSRIFDATLALSRRELTGASLRRLLLRYPFQAARTGFHIYSHALVLALKGAPRFPHPAALGDSPCVASERVCGYDR